MHGAAFKTLHRLLIRGKDSEEPIEPGKLQILHCAWRNCCETHVAIPLDRPFQATEQKVQSVLVHLPQPSAIEDNPRPLNIHAALQFAKEEPPSFYVQTFR